MNNLTGLRFYVNEELNLVIDDYRGKTNKHKVISINTLCKLVEKNINGNIFETGILPERCIAYREETGNNRFVALDLGCFNMDITYEQTKYENFPVPRLLYGFRLDGANKIREVQVAVADMGTLRDDTKLYKYPFSNVEGFNMCIGGNVLPQIKKLRQLNGIPYYIFAMPDNNDRYMPDRTRLNMEYRNLLEHLKDKDTEYYYNSVLIPSGKTLKDFIYKNGG